jgi:DNA-binding CsgD family transcriptional regulator
MYLESKKVRTLADLLGFLNDVDDFVEFQNETGKRLMRLIEADIFASFCYNETRKSFENGYGINIDKNNIDAYQTFYQYHDILHRKLRHCNGPVIVSSVVPTKIMIESEFYNDFLIMDGLYYGLNCYFKTCGKYIGDMRLWRPSTREDFVANDVEILTVIRPQIQRCMERLTAHTDRLDKHGFTKRERDVLFLACKGASDKEIMRMLGISLSTTRTHMNHIFEKAGCSKRSLLHLFLKNDK